MTTRILRGHVPVRLAELADESVHCCVTSPPYFGLRSYGTEPQSWGGDPSWRGDLGLEPSPELYIAHLVEVFQEVRRVLRKDGTLWLNIGDSYAGGTGVNNNGQGKSTIGFRADGSYSLGKEGSPCLNELSKRQQTPVKIRHGLKPKDLIGIPWMLAFALRADGWWLRSEIIWAKKSTMPESVTDRPTCAHEKVFLLTKSARYFWDAEAVKEDSEYPDDDRKSRANPSKEKAFVSPLSARVNPGSATYPKRNLRNVWRLGPEPFPEAHFATFPTEIPRICIKAGTSERGVCPKCGAPWERVLDKSVIWPEKRGGTGGVGANRNDRDRSTQTIGWNPTCSCDAEVPVSATVLDPFLGAGTTALVADQLGRDCIGIELNTEYAQMAERRLRDDAGMFAQVGE